jgi:hypothetical protein
MPHRSVAGAERCHTRTPETPALRPRILHQAQPRCLCRRRSRRTRQDVCAVSAVYACVLCLVSSDFSPLLFYNQVFLSKKKNTYTGTVMRQSMHVQYPSPSHYPRTKPLTHYLLNTSPASPPRRRTATEPRPRPGARSPPTQRSLLNSRRSSL